MLLGRALIQNAHTLIMDEPTASLDYGNSFRVMQRIEALSAGGYSVIFSTHEPNQAFRYATKVLALKDGPGAGLRPAGTGAHAGAFADALRRSGRRHAGAGRQPRLFPSVRPM